MEDRFWDKAAGRYLEENERVLYSDDQDLVTDKRVVLGRESWRITEIEDIEVVTRSNFWMVGMTRRHIPGLIAALILMLLYLTGFIWAPYLPNGGCLQSLLFMLCIGTVLLTIYANPGEFYSVKLKLSGDKIHEVQRTWRDKSSLEEIIRTVRGLTRAEQVYKNS